MNTIKRTLIIALMLLGVLNTVNAVEQFQAGTEDQKVILSLSNGKKLPLKQRELSRMGMVKNLVETQDTTQEANEPLEILLDDHLVTPEAGTLLMGLMEEVLGDRDYETYSETVGRNKEITKKHLNVLTDKKRLAGNADKFNLLKELYKAVDYLNVQLLKTEAQNIASQASADNALQELIAHEAAHSLLASDFGSVDLTVNNHNLDDQLKLELAQRYKNKVLVNQLSINGHQEAIRDAQVSTDGKILMTHSNDKVIVRNIQTGAVLCSVTIDYGHNIINVQLSTDGNILMIHSHRLMDQKVMVYNAQSGAVLYTVTKGDITGHQEDIHTVQLSFDDNILITRSFGKVMVHNAQSGAVLYTVTKGDITGHQKTISCPKFNTNDNILITHSYDKVMARDVQSGAILYAVTQGDFNGHQKDIYGVELSADGKTLKTASSDKLMVHNLPVTAHSSQKPSSKFITQINNDNKTVSIYQQDFTEEIVRDLSLEQIYVVIYAQKHRQEYPKIVITPTTDAQTLGVNVKFVEGLQEETKVKNTQPVASSSND